MTPEQEILAIKTCHIADLCDARNVWIIEELGAEFVVHRWSADGVAPQSHYPTLRKAAARLLQLLGTGAVAPQTWPETACIGETAFDSEPPPSPAPAA